MTRPSSTLVGTNLNSVWIEGRLVADPVGSTPAGARGCRFTIRDEWSDEPDAGSMFVVEAPEGAIEGGQGRLGRGHRVRIIGRLTQERHEVKIVGDLVETLGP